MTPAEQEAYASCTSRTIQLCTIELNHPEFTQPLYAVRDNQDLTAELEDGSIVTFLTLGFDITRQPTDKEPDPTITLKVDNITGKLSPGSGLNVCLGMNINPELYLVDQEANDNIVHFFKLRKTNGFSGQPFDPYP